MSPLRFERMIESFVANWWVQVGTLAGSVVLTRLSIPMGPAAMWQPYLVKIRPCRTQLAAVRDGMMDRLLSLSVS